MSFASLPTASILPVFWLTATIEGSETTTPLPFAKTSVFEVPRSIARSLEKKLRIDPEVQLRILFPVVLSLRLPRLADSSPLGPWRDSSGSRCRNCTRQARRLALTLP